VLAAVQALVDEESHSEVAVAAFAEALAGDHLAEDSHLATWEVDLDLA
jgi:hypothetical protein